MTSGTDERGFSLIEVLVASVIMIIGVLGLLAVFPQSLNSTRQSGRMSVLNHLVTQKLEQLRAQDLSDADLALGTHPTIATDSRGDRYYPVPGFPELYSLRWTVTAGPTDATGTAEPDLRTVAIEATHLVRYDLLANPVSRPNSREATSLTFVTD